MVGGPILVVILLGAIAFIVWATGKARMNAFLVLLIAALAVGLLARRPPPVPTVNELGQTVPGLIDVIATGFGNTLASIGIVIVAGTIIGSILAKTGGAPVLAQAMLKLVGKSRSPLAMALAGYVVSIPVFCDSGFVILSPLNKALSQSSGISLGVLGTALSMGLYATHTMVPPTPGPIAAAGTLGADLGLVILFGLIASLPATIAGWIYAVRVGSRFDIKTAQGSSTVSLITTAAIVAPLLPSLGFDSSMGRVLATLANGGRLNGRIACKRLVFLGSVAVLRDGCKHRLQTADRRHLGDRPGGDSDYRDNVSDFPGLARTFPLAVPAQRRKPHTGVSQG